MLFTGHMQDSVSKFSRIGIRVRISAVYKTSAQYEPP